jgi:hypothetical protein
VLGVEVAPATAGVAKGRREWKRGLREREKEGGGEWRCGRVGWADATRREEVGQMRRTRVEINEIEMKFRVRVSRMVTDIVGCITINIKSNGY